jgi:hypothetical protein
MLPSLLVAAAVTAPAAPVPRDALPNTTGPAPRVAAVKADATGSVWITAYVYTKQKVQQQYFVIENNQQVMKTREVEQTVSNYVRKTIGDFGGKFTTADGTTLSTQEATRRVKDGATLLITADGKPVDKVWLRAVAGDTVVMAAEGLAHAHFVSGSAPYPTTAAPRLALLGTDDNGNVRLPVNPAVNNGSGGVYYDEFGNGRVIRRAVPNGAGGVDIIETYSPGTATPSATTPPGPDGKKALADVKFDAYDVNGKLVPQAEALKRLKAGGLVVLAGDNRFPDAEYLKALRDDVLVLVSGELVFPATTPNPYDMPVKTAEAPAKPANAPAKPANAAAPVQVAPAVGVAAPAVLKRIQIDK